MRYYIIAGEASGDLHGSNLIKELRPLDSAAHIRCWGGDKMQAQGATLVKHYRDLAFMGFVEVIKNLRTIFKNLAFCKEDILQHKPDVLILIDYPGFNLRIAKWAKQQGLKVIYYISPQIWAWKENRVHDIKRSVDKMLVILPFEKEFYKKWNYEVEYVGHPLVKVIDDYKLQSPVSKSENIIAILPGSRKQEILKKLPIMLKVAESFPEYNFIVAKAPGIEESFYTTLLAPYSNVGSVENKTYELLMRSKAAMVTSGTATLETALFGVPEVICYKGGSISYQIAKRLIKIKYICLVNLIMDKEVVKELIQNDLTVENLVREIKNIIEDPIKQQQLKDDYTALKNLLSKGGNASANAAESIYKFLTNASAT
ncbi:lipid-A-disaccharide synthase [Ferruginibacter lapsinanis]|uniref:lipid-A-disaccharide synthase n=1 Tax=Ferruginibacter lapsinanis TaxID=563172 RepID=UPI001E499282|nr:lipid-A-disaccharide synthase [Ferruginibacter lapsinanis]UEG50148.1 lipid-A-disaccharide synthase [Ferruginibacter lapsinanis]